MPEKVTLRLPKSDGSSESRGVNPQTGLTPYTYKCMRIGMSTMIKVSLHRNLKETIDGLKLYIWRYKQIMQYHLSAWTSNTPATDTRKQKIARQSM